ncbi:MAG: ABC transporter ATP-binding protein [Clostridium sp.]|uniref:ABC transporter ATP-binding protein n=1 Tax=Clostridium sp. TaxID=1506 RepID=UPI00304C6D0A
MDYCIEANNLMKSYKSKIALSDISVKLNSNELIGLIGSNGSGKTTFMKLCAGLLEKTQGELTVLGGAPMDNLNVLENIVYCYPNMPHDRNLSLLKITEYYKIMYPTFDFQFASKLLKHFDFNTKYKYDSLSQGMKSLFNFICGISTRASLTMFDEPILGMDVKVRKSVYDILLRDYIEHPRTIIISSHILSELENLLSELLIINDGTLVLYKDMDSIKESAYRVDGSSADLKEFFKNKNVLHENLSDFSAFGIIEEAITSSMEAEAKSRNLKISRIRPEELYVYLTGNNYEGGLDSLWTNDN